MLGKLTRRRDERGAPRIMLLTLAVIAVLGVIATSTLFLVTRELRSARASYVEVQRTREIIEGVQNVLLMMQDAETGERGFVITGGDAFLQPFETASSSLEQELQKLDEAIVDPRARLLFEQIAARSREQIAFLGSVVALRRSGQVVASSNLISQGQGKRQMDLIRVLVAQLKHRQKSLLDTRLARFRKSSIEAERTAQLSLAAAVVLALITSVLWARNYERRRLAEAAYRDQAIRLGATLDNVAEAIITINESGSIESWSKGAEAMFGYTGEEVLRRNVNILMPQPHAAAHDGYLRRYIATGERRIMGMRRELEAQHKDGHRFPVELAVSEMHLDSRRVFIGSMRDISLRLEVERLKSGFVSTVSHELRTPLTSISGSLGLLAGGVAGQMPEKARRLIDIALSNSQRLVRLINDILDLEKAESGKMEFNLEPLPIKPIVEQAIDMNRGHAQSLGIVIELSAACEDANVLVDRDRLIQVLANLLSNAAKFSPRDGVVRVDIRTELDGVRVEVQDQGPGITPEFQKRIFQKFAQGDSSDTRAKGGTGLGLSICKSLIERLGGSIGFTSREGSGTTFYFTLPAHRMPAEHVAVASGTFANPRVLVCEDDPDVAEVLLELLTNNGMQPKVTANAEGAVAALEQETFDIAVIDVDLPDVDGLELVEQLRARSTTCALPIIVLTARARVRVQPQRLAALRLAEWLQKPADPQRLLRAIRDTLAESRPKRGWVLHVEDDESLIRVMREAVRPEFEVVAAHSLAEARERLRGAHYQAVILDDIILRDGSGLELLQELEHGGGGPVPVVIYSSTEVSKELAGKVDFALVKSRDSVTAVLSALREIAA